MIKRERSKNWRIVIPNLIQYKNSTPQELLDLKYLILDRLKFRPQLFSSSIKSEFQRGLKHYRIALEHHANGVPHLDILLVYDKSIQRRYTDYDYLLKHGDVTTYRLLNEAILHYGTKEDPNSLSNFPTLTDPITHQSKSDYSSILQFQKFQSDPYRYLELQMRKDPLHFKLEEYCQKNDLASYISNWSSLKTKLKDMQTAAANLLLKNKQGFKLITRQLIQHHLSPSQLSTYDSWSGYQTIVNYLNQMIIYGYKRPLKTKNLLITGLPNIGKTSLFEIDLYNSTNCVEKYIPVYPMGTKTWWPNYKPQVYKLIFWNEAKLTSYSYDTILKVLEGSKVDLPYKGGSVLKYDNPLVIMTSNLSLQQMIHQKFSYDKSYEQIARQNLSVRIQNVIVPPKYDLFLLQKLLISPDPSPSSLGSL